MNRKEGPAVSIQGDIPSGTGPAPRLNRTASQEGTAEDNPTSSRAGNDRETSGWWIVCVSCRRVVKAEYARPVITGGAGSPGGVSLFGCPFCHQRTRSPGHPEGSDGSATQ
jgi:hypothetical protein